MGDAMVAYEWVLGVALFVSVLLGILLTYQKEVLKDSAESCRCMYGAMFCTCFLVAEYLAKIFRPGESVFFLVVLVGTYVAVHSVIKTVVMLFLQLFRRGCP
jgi:uncharacterized membrane protein HdeD (DUF308 family)